MDLVTLKSPAEFYQPDILVEGYNSLVWAERFTTLGDFELKSFDIGRMMQVLPKGTLLSHLDTKEVMEVETHEIQMVGEGSDARPEITVRGRSATSILEHRWVESTYQTKRRMRMTYSATSAAAVLLVNALNNISGKDLTRGDTDPKTKTELNDYAWTKLDALPNVAITESVASEGAAKWWLLEEGVLYPQLIAILDQADLGVRCIRPTSPNPATVVAVSATLSNRGTVTRTSVADVPQLRFDVYSGADRSSSVQFSLLQGHLQSPQYLMSSRDRKTHVELMSGAIEVGDVYLPGESELSGWARRSTGIDAGTPEIPAAPEKPAELRKNATRAQKEARADAMDEWIDDYAAWKNKRAQIIADFTATQRAAATRELKAGRIDMFSADVSSLSPYVYQRDYFLGDTVMLYGDYGKASKMVVGEYVRTEDEGGDRGFPGLVVP